MAGVETEGEEVESLLALLHTHPGPQGVGDGGDGRGQPGEDRGGGVERATDCAVMGGGARCQTERRVSQYGPLAPRHLTTVQHSSSESQKEQSRHQIWGFMRKKFIFLFFPTIPIKWIAGLYIND